MRFAVAFLVCSCGCPVEARVADLTAAYAAAKTACVDAAQTEDEGVRCLVAVETRFAPLWSPFTGAE